MGSNKNHTKESLLEIARRHGKSIPSLMLDIQDSQIAQIKFLEFIKDLECLALDDHRPATWSRYWIDAHHNQDYVALSCTWRGSKYEDSTSGRYQVQTRDKARFEPSSVRNCVFDRILKYMNRFKINLLWIDKHSIPQQACKKLECTHSRCDRKRKGLQTMDLVYKLSKHPVALLGRPIDSDSDLELLAKILRGKLVSQDRRTRKIQLSEETSREEASSALLLLRNITSDRWWRRAWTFQESYRAGTAMKLLIPHRPSLEKRKQSYNIELFSDIRGELCIDAVTFSFEASRLCLAFREIRPKTPEERSNRRHILATAGRYSVLLEGHESMTPIVISDIGKRRIENKYRWERLAIAANCCQYTVRLNTAELLGKGHSLSLSMLTMCLLNGEILHNEKAHGSLAHMTASTFLKKQSFKGFYAPLDTRSLSFNKGCRFIHTRLTANGIATKGHIWQLGRVIHSRELKRQPSWVKNPVGKLNLHERKRLTQLANRLKSLKLFPLARCVTKYLHRDSRSCSGDVYAPETYAARYMRMMASELVHAIDRGMVFRLGSLWDPSGRKSSYRAIFIWGNGAEGMEDENEKKLKSAQRNGPILAFTSSRPQNQGSDRHDTNDIDRHVSLIVQHQGFIDNNPRLIIDRWLLGLCFFEGCLRRDVAFPWPPGLEEICPSF